MLLFLLTVILPFSLLHTAEFRSFADSMRLYRSEYVVKTQQLTDWQYAQELFNKCIQNEPKSNSDIPKIFHFIWLGNKPLTKEMQEYIASWKKHHPDWEFKLWKDTDVEKFGLKNKYLYTHSTNMGKRSDIARYEILYRYGGVYVDTDFECFAPITPICQKTNFFAALDDAAASLYCFNGIIGTQPRHPILRACINKLTSHSLRNESANAILQQTGPEFFTAVIKQYWKAEVNILLLPYSYLIALPRELAALPREKKLKYITPITFAMHHWHGSWLPGR